MNTDDYQSSSEEYAKGFMVKDCAGWTGPKYNTLLRHCLAEHVMSSCDMNNPLNNNSFKLADRYQSFKGYDKLCFSVEGNKYVLRATDCSVKFRMPVTGHAGKRLCDCCASLSVSVASIRNDSNMEIKLSSKSRLSSKRRSILPDEACDLVDVVRKKSRNDKRNDKKRKCSTLSGTQASASTALVTKTQKGDSTS